MLKTKLGFLAVGIGLILASCATLEKDQCAVANWQELGFADGQQGRPAERVASYREDCAKFGIPIDGQSYRVGWEAGIRQYCTPENGFERGINGRFARNSCPASISAQFQQPYNLGREIYELDRNIEAIQLKIDKLNADLDLEGLPRKTRRLLRKERRELRFERRDNRDTLADALAEARALGFNVNY